MSRIVFRVIALALAGALLAAPSHAQIYRALFETAEDSSGVAYDGTTELTFVNFNSYADMIAGNAASTDFLPFIDVNPDYSISGLTIDNGIYRALFETDFDSLAPRELAFVNYNSYADMLAGVSSGTDFININISPAYSFVGLTIDNGIYRALLEYDFEGTAPSELIFINYNSYADMVAGNAAGSNSTQINVTAGYSIAGLDIDNGIYRLLLEADFDSASPTELAFVSYNSYADMVAGNVAGSDYIDLDVSPHYSIVGLEIAPHAVPGPASLVTFGMAALRLRRRGRPNKKVAPI